MTSRVLPPAEWPRLAGTEAEGFVAHLTDAARVVVVEHDGAIVGCHVLQPVLHAEGLWIHPEYRKKASVARRLWSTVRQTARETFGVQWVATGAASDDIRGLLEHVGAVKLPDHYMVPVGDRDTCQP